MKTSEILYFLQQEIHSTVFATIDHTGLPVTCFIDIMLADEESLYFLTARGKSFYDRLTANPVISLSGMKGEDTMSSQSVTVRGKVRELGSGLLVRIFSHNPYMNEIYPNVESRSALTVFQIYEGNGELFDLSQKPIFRQSFAFGGANQTESGYYVNDNCTGCKQCHVVCPQSCINVEQTPAVIEASHCIHCGRCAEVCPAGAVKRHRDER